MQRNSSLGEPTHLTPASNCTSVLLLHTEGFSLGITPDWVDLLTCAYGFYLDKPWLYWWPTLQATGVPSNHLHGPAWACMGLHAVFKIVFSPRVTHVSNQWPILNLNFHPIAMQGYAKGITGQHKKRSAYAYYFDLHSNLAVCEWNV